MTINDRPPARLIARHEVKAPEAVFEDARSLCMSGLPHVLFVRAGKVAREWYDDRLRETVVMM